MHSLNLVPLGTMLAAATSCLAAAVTPVDSFIHIRQDNHTAIESTTRLASRAPPGVNPAKNYEDAVNVGRQITAGMFQPGEVGQHANLGNAEEQLAASGWSLYNSNHGKDEIERCIRPVLAKYLSMLEPTELKLKHYKQDGPYTVNGKKYPPTKGESKNYYGPGIIFSVQNASPSWNTKNAENPPLTHWSDIVILQYHSLFPDNELEYIVQCNIEDAFGTGVYEFLKRKFNLPKTIAFPGLEYKPKDEIFSAILGTIYGKGVAFALGQHRPDFGWLVVYEINMWFDFFGTPSILFKIRSGNEGSTSQMAVAGSSKGKGKEVTQGSSKGKESAQDSSKGKGSSQSSSKGKGSNKGSSSGSKKGQGSAGPSRTQKRSFDIEDRIASSDHN